MRQQQNFSHAFFKENFLNNFSVFSQTKTTLITHTLWRPLHKPPTSIFCFFFLLTYERNYYNYYYYIITWKNILINWLIFDLLKTKKKKRKTVKKKLIRKKLWICFGVIVWFSGVNIQHSDSGSGSILSLVNNGSKSEFWSFDDDRIGF